MDKKQTKASNVLRTQRTSYSDVKVGLSLQKGSRDIGRVKRSPMDRNWMSNSNRSELYSKSKSKFYGERNGAWILPVKLA